MRETATDEVEALRKSLEDVLVFVPPIGRLAYISQKIVLSPKQINPFGAAVGWYERLSATCDSIRKANPCIVRLLFEDLFETDKGVMVWIHCVWKAPETV
jgi:hypothetical protein